MGLRDISFYIVPVVLIWFCQYHIFESIQELLFLGLVDFPLVALYCTLQQDVDPQHRGLEDRANF